MTFNEGMRIDTSTTSTSGGGRGPGRGIAVGGGVGGLLIVVVALFLGVDPSSVLSQQPMDTQGVETPGFDLSQCKTGEDANTIVQCRVVATGNSLDGVWAQLMPDYTRPKVEIFTNSVNTGGCGSATSDVGPFYCPRDETAYFDTGFFDTLVTQFGSSGGPFAQEYVVAHEFGHHVQNLQGVLGRAQQDPTGPTGGGVRTELQADCYAGVWAHHASASRDQNGQEFLQPLSSDDIDSALSAASAVGDDHIQGDVAGGQVNPETWTHGSSEQRRAWFTQGYGSGDPRSCDTFESAEV